MSAQVSHGPSFSGQRRSVDDRHASSAADGPFSPAGLKVLVVDDDPMCLKVVSAMLKRCQYQVETTSSGTEAIALLRERQEDHQFDLVLSDVYMPDIDGFKLLEHIGLELDIPVIMMSSNGDTNVVLRGVTHGAVDFLIKPVRVEELRNVWQHVVRRRSLALNRAGDDASVDCEEGSRHGTKRKENEVLRAEHEQGSGSKKPRVIWTQEMHQQFVQAVNHLGIDKAFPKRILDLMKVEGLTRENVASHLQKYRLYLKRVENHTQAGVTGVNGSKNALAGIRGGVEDMMMTCAEAEAAEQQNRGAGSKTGAAGGDASNGHNQQQQQQGSMPSATPSGAGPSGMTATQHQQAMMGMANFAAWQQQTMAMQAAAAAAAAASNAHHAMAAQGGMGPWGPHQGIPHPPMMNPGFAAMAAAGMQPGMMPPPQRPPPGMDMNAVMAAQQYHHAQAAAAAAAMRYPAAGAPTAGGAGGGGPQPPAAATHSGAFTTPAAAAVPPRLHNSNSMPSFPTNSSLFHSSTQHQAGTTTNGHGGASNANNTNGGHGSNSTTDAKPLVGTNNNNGFPSFDLKKEPHTTGFPNCLPGNTETGQPYSLHHHSSFLKAEEPLLPTIDSLGPGALDDPLGLTQPPKSEGVDAFFDMFLDKNQQ